MVFYYSSLEISMNAAVEKFEHSLHSPVGLVPGGWGASQL